MEVNCRIVPALPNKCKLDKNILNWKLIDQTITGEPMFEIKSIDHGEVRNDLQKLKESGVESVAVVFAHSYTAPQHELAVGQIAKELGKFITKIYV